MRERTQPSGLALKNILHGLVVEDVRDPGDPVRVQQIRNISRLIDEWETTGVQENKPAAESSGALVEPENV